VSSPSTASDPATAVEPVLECLHLRKRYGHVVALDDASLRLQPGQVTALVGDNGAGKSTLVRLLAGMERPDGGEVWVHGRPVTFASPRAARHHGIETVYQDLALAPDLDGASNVYLGRELRRLGWLGRLGFLDDRQMRRLAGEQLAGVGVTVADVASPVDRLSGGQRQAIAVARALQWASSVFLLDEPTAALGAVQTRRVLGLARQAASSGVAVLLISHDLPEVLEVADRVVVLRHGCTVADRPADQLDAARLLDLMMGVAGVDS
jgi:simple sugar transport system ATP-binding protein